MSAVSEAPLPHGKRNASPGPSPQNKRRRVDAEAPASTNHPKSVLANLGLAIGTGNTLTQAKLKSVAGLLAPSANTPRGTSRAPKGKKPSPVAGSNPPSIASGAGTATDPVIISDEPPNQSLSAPTTARRTTRSQEAHMLLDTLPDDPSDVLTQTLRTILKNPTTVPRGRSSVSRDTAVYLANGRLTGTPFLRLLRHLASPARRTNPGLGLTLLKKLVEAMRATEEASKPAQAGLSSAASTPMPVTPETPSTTLFATQDGSSLRCTNEKPFEPSLFPEVDFPTMGASASPLPTIIEADPIASTGFAIDPELLALSSNPGNTQNPNTSQNLESLEVDLAELFGALPPAGSDGTTLADVPVPMLQPLPIDTSIDWNALTDLPFEDLLSTWNPENQCLPIASLPQAGPHPFPSSLPTVQQPTLSTPSIFDQAPKQQASSFGTVRIPPRAEALALLERAHARKKELEARLLATRRQLWGCKIEAGVERNVLEALKKT